MSDLQCPATVLLVPSEIVRSEECRRALAGRRLFGFFVDAGVANDPDDVAAVSGVAGACDCAVERVGACVDAASLSQVLEELSDAYRGQNVVLVTAGKLIQARLHLERTPRAPVALAIDSDGWAVKPA